MRFSAPNGRHAIPTCPLKYSCAKAQLSPNLIQQQIRTLESRMLGNSQIRVGGGLMEKHWVMMSRPTMWVPIPPVLVCRGSRSGVGERGGAHAPRVR